MQLRRHHKFLIIALGVMITYVAVTEFEPTVLYKPDNWATISIAIGATILTLVGIITSILVSNENNRRVEFIENLSFSQTTLRKKADTNPDRSLTEIYDNSIRRLRALIDEMSPLKYSEGIIGIFSFFFFLTSALLAICGYPFKLVIGNFIVGIVLLAGYVMYIIEEFLKIDASSALPKKKGKLTLRTVRLNGQALHFDPQSKEPVIHVTQRIRRMEFGIRFEGQVRNGFFHAIIRYRNGQSTHIPEPNTYLGETVFAEGRILVISPDRRLDTGILQSNGPVELLFEVCRDITENPQIGEMEIFGLGRRNIHRFCSISDGFQVNAIEIRMYEDPFFKPNYKRREIDLITVYLKEH